jgi:anti-anti-sigma factor
MDVFPSRHDENQHVITVRGEVDLANADGLLLRLLVLAGPATGEIALDLAQVTFMDCAGLRTLIALDHHVRTAGGSMRVTAVSPEVARLFELARRQRNPPMFPTPPALGAPQHAATPVRHTDAPVDAYGRSRAWPMAGV